MGSISSLIELLGISKDDLTQRELAEIKKLIIKNLSKDRSFKSLARVSAKRSKPKAKRPHRPKPRVFHRKGNVIKLDNAN